MSRVPQTESDLRAHLHNHQGFMDASGRAFDAGFQGEAARLAVSVRVLLHDTERSRSLLTQLGSKSTVQWLDTAMPYDPDNVTAHSGLVGWAFVDGPAIPWPWLDDPPVPPRLIPFDDWWNGYVFVDKRGQVFSREDLVLYVANQDGGAHVDSELSERYVQLTRENGLGFEDVLPDGRTRPVADHTPAAIRQIAHEVLRTLDPAYRCPGPSLGDRLLSTIPVLAPVGVAAQAG